MTKEANSVYSILKDLGHDDKQIKDAMCDDAVLSLLEVSQECAEEIYNSL